MGVLWCYLAFGLVLAAGIVIANAKTDGRFPAHVGNHSLAAAGLGVVFMFIWPLVLLLVLLAFIHGLFGGKS